MKYFSNLQSGENFWEKNYFTLSAFLSQDGIYIKTKALSSSNKPGGVIN